MTGTTLDTLDRTPAQFDLLFSRLHKVFVRFDRMADEAFAVVLDRSTLTELPDYVHLMQLVVVK